MTRIEVEGREVLIQKISSTLWKVSTPILEGSGEFSEELNESLKLLEQMKWENVGTVEIDNVTGTIHWTQQIHPSNFGKEFPQFLKDAQEWAELLSQKFPIAK
ncbi:MAG: hypothetical protein JSS10_04120 [Verrucomicrobia bacterium]|nr:hypothetical protein [Verrucomicrobiota bacterium]